MADPVIAPISLPGDILWKAESAKKDTAGAFKSILADTIHEVQNYQDAAGKGVESLLAGTNDDLHGIAIANQKAELSFELLLQTRNKLVQAYQEVMRMQI